MENTNKNNSGLRSSLIIILLACFLGAVNYTATGQQKTSPQITVKEALKHVKENMGYSVWFVVKDIELNKKISVNLNNKDIKQVLSEVLKDQPLEYEIQGNVINITKKKNKSNRDQKPGVISGQVIDSKDGNPLIGCTVNVKGQHEGAVFTDIDGFFSINANPDDILIFSYVGYENIEKKAGSLGNLEVKMQNNEMMLDDIVVTGYQILKKYNVTGAVNTIDSKSIDIRSTNSFSSILEGAVPGVSVYKGEIAIRGGASINSGSTPLIIVDDFEVEQLPENMDLVESITVLKDAAATAIWGSRAANGVIVVTTKKGKTNDFKISYSGNMKISAKPDYSDLHRVSSKDLIEFQRDIFMNNYYMRGYFDQGTFGYNLAEGIMKDYLPEDPKIPASTISPEQLKEMDGRLAKLAENSNRKQIKDELLRNAFEQQHFLSISGATDKINYFLSGSFINRHSSYVGDENKSTNINSRTSYKILPILSLRSDINATFSTKDLGYQSLASDINNLYPYQMLIDENGERVMDYTKFNKDFADRMLSDYTGFYHQGKNLLDEVGLANNKEKTTHYKVRVGTDLKLLEGLNISADYQYEKLQSETKNNYSDKTFFTRDLINRYTVHSNDKITYYIPQGNILDQGKSDVAAWIFKLGATLNRNFGSEGQHYINGVAGFELRDRHYYRSEHRYYGYHTQILSHKPINNAEEIANGIRWIDRKIYSYDYTDYESLGDLVNKEISYFVSGVYTYNNRYTASASLRIDESNLFGVDKKYRRNPIWSFGANWNIKEEAFFNSNAITQMMLRTSFGLTGNFDRSGLTTGRLTGRRTFLSIVDDYVTRIKNPANPKLRWERSKSINASVDMGILNRVNTTFTFYNNSIDDLLGEMQIPPENGFSEAKINGASMINRGFELMLNAHPIKTINFDWNLNLVFTYNYNKITKNQIRDSNPALNKPSGTTKYTEGYTREALWSYRWAGLDEAGEPTVYDRDGNRVYDIENFEEEDLVYGGTYTPKYTGSFSTGFRYKNCQLNFLFIYNFGHKMRTEYPDMNPYQMKSGLNKKIADRWRQQGDENKTDIAALVPPTELTKNTYRRDNINRYSSNSIRSGNMIRLREILFNYELPGSILRSLPIKRLAITLQANNVFLWTVNKENLDPEAISPISGALSLRDPFYFTAGLKIDF